MCATKAFRNEKIYGGVPMAVALLGGLKTGVVTPEVRESNRKEERQEKR